MMLFCCYSDTNNTTDDPPEVSQDIGESPSTPLNTPQPPGKKQKVKKFNDVDEDFLKSLKDSEEKQAQPQDTEDLFGKQVAVVLKGLHPRQRVTMDECYGTPFIRSHRIHLAHKAKLWPKMYGIEYQFIENQGLVCQLGDFQMNGQYHRNNRSLHTRGFFTMGDLEKKIGNSLVDIYQNIYNWFLW